MKKFGFCLSCIYYSGKATKKGLIHMQCRRFPPDSQGNYPRVGRRHIDGCWEFKSHKEYKKENKL